MLKDKSTQFLAFLSISLFTDTILRNSEQHPSRRWATDLVTSGVVSLTMCGNSLTHDGMWLRGSCEYIGAITPDLQRLSPTDYPKIMHTNLVPLFAAFTLTCSGQAALHGLIVGNFVQGSLYSVTFDDETFALSLVANTSVPAPSSWLSWNVSHISNVSSSCNLLCR
jgi:hypothetical protein